MDAWTLPTLGPGLRDTFAGPCVENAIIFDMAVRDLIVVGAGPTGLSVAIAAKQRGLDYQILERGTLVNSIYRPLVGHRPALPAASEPARADDPPVR